MPDEETAPATRDASIQISESIERVTAREEEERRAIIGRSDFRTTPKISRTLQMAALLMLGVPMRDDSPIVIAAPTPREPIDPKILEPARAPRYSQAAEEFAFQKAVDHVPVIVAPAPAPRFAVPPGHGKTRYVSAIQARARGELAADPKGFDADGGTVQRPGPLRRAFGNSIPKESKLERRMRRRNKSLRR